jgi:hypothetical protein
VRDRKEEGQQRMIRYKSDVVGSDLFLKIERENKKDVFLL